MEEENGEDREIRLVNQCGIYLVKTLCIDTNATTAKLTQDITQEGKFVGAYRITIEKL